jgi:uncharacterized MAPEG superfamily protein
MEPLSEMPTEIVLLGWGVVLLLVQLVLQAVAGVGELGLPYALSPRDERKQVSGVMAARLERAFYNLLQTFPAFVALALALALTGKTGGLGAIGAHLWFWSRIVYVPLYAFGIPGLRTAAWAVALIGLILMLIALLA